MTEKLVEYPLRVVVIGGPKSGKSTIARLIYDCLKEHGFSPEMPVDVLSSYPDPNPLQPGKAGKTDYLPERFDLSNSRSLPKRVEYLSSIKKKIFIDMMQTWKTDPDTGAPQHRKSRPYAQPESDR